MPETSLSPLMRNTTVCFTGHRQLPEDELPALVLRLNQVVEALWQRGYRQFICGGALGFDTLAAEAVIRLKEIYPQAKLILAIPYVQQSHAWSDTDSMRYERIIYHADETRVLSQHYYRGCMMTRNRFMVNHSSLCVCYMTEIKGGTASTIAYASREGVSLLNIAMEDACAAFVQQTLTSS